MHGWTDVHVVVKYIVELDRTSDVNVNRWCQVGTSINRLYLTLEQGWARESIGLENRVGPGNKMNPGNKVVPPINVYVFFDSCLLPSAYCPLY